MASVDPALRGTDKEEGCRLRIGRVDSSKAGCGENSVAGLPSNEAYETSPMPPPPTPALILAASLAGTGLAATAEVEAATPAHEAGACAVPPRAGAADRALGSCCASPVSACPTRDSDPSGFRTALLAGGAVGGVHAYGLAVWWKDGFGPEFTTKNEGWFGGGTEHGGQDKLGHFMFAYAGTRLLTRGFEGTGSEGSAALRLGTATAYGALTSVEVIDGLARGWHFSPEDFVMNTAGAVAAVLSERSPAFDRLLDFRIHYSRSTRPDGRRSGWEPVSDYSGQTYYLVMKAEGVAALDRIPGVRLLELALGYGARGFETGGERQQYTYIGVAINLGKLLREHVWKGSDPRAQFVSDNVFEYIQFRGSGAWSAHR